MANWILDGLIATSSRPGYVPGSEFSVPSEHLYDWSEKVRSLGIASVMCLLDNDQLPLYEGAYPGGLLEFYRSEGYAVAHIPTFDGLTTPFTGRQYTRAWDEFLRLPKPVVVHCSAGMDRTGRIVRYLLQRMETEPGWRQLERSDAHSC